ncbi:MAG: DUF5676 family membrane protein [Candidatus Nanoarchaeia archaeon]|nr:DUF5676 family membrane protein [Candidatus Nanoarchaeia archaeon]MDD5740632.1 DUF5676 family membrane protein [Candidatus Nanoarchaeia archaeon]
MKLDKCKIGLIVGIFFAVVHAVWAILVGVIPGVLQNFLDWIFNLHFLEPVWILTSFNLLNAVMLVIITFICGYIIGWVFALIWNCLAKK